MRGSPLLRAILAFLVIASMGLPLWRLTQRKADAAVQPKPAEAGVATVKLQLSFTAPPAGFKIRHLEREIWSASSAEQEMEQEVQLAWPEEGVDLQVQITWPAGTLAAARVRLTDPAGEEHERTVWGGGEVEEVLTFP